MASERQGPGTEDDDDLDIESSGTPQPRLPGRLDFPTRPQAAMNATADLPNAETARRAFEVLRRTSFV